MEGWVFKSRSKRDLPLGKRDYFAVSSLEMNEIESAFKAIVLIRVAMNLARRFNCLTQPMRTKKMQLAIFILSFVASMLAVPVPEPLRILQKRLPHKTLNDFAYLEYPNSNGGTEFSEKFRFHNRKQIRRLMHGFQIPETATCGTYTFSGDEIVLISLTRMAYPSRWSDVMKVFPSRKRWELGRAFYWFINFMVYKWGYLVLNNREFWKPYLPQCAEAIREKLANLPNESYRQHHPSTYKPGRFCIAMFIDNTISAMCSVGGGPITGDEQAPRVPKEVQQAWWTGWKKLHGLKWQTTDLPNGMNFEVRGPVSLRHNDNYTLDRSDIEEKLL